MIRSETIAEALFNVLFERVVMDRAPDFVVGRDNPHGPYMNRWFLTPWRRWQERLQQRAHADPTRWNRWTYAVARLIPNVYLHEFLRDDDDRALHDHPSWGASYLLRGGYTEHTIAAGGVHHRTTYYAGDLRFLPTRHAHRIELFQTFRASRGVTNHRLPCWTLFLFGPRVREWGFHCPERGWVPWREFTAPNDPGAIGPGCD